MIRAAKVDFCHSGSHFTSVLPLPLPLYNSQNLAKDQALAALPPVVALMMLLMEISIDGERTRFHFF
jgi:hypothetical protein